MSLLFQIESAADFLRSKFGPPPKVACVLGSGLGSFTEAIQNSKRIAFSEIPGALESKVQGHHGSVVYGDCAGHKVLVLSGRIHGYEGHSPNEVVFLVRACSLWGIKKFIITNASGSTHAEFEPGSLVFLKDLINFTGRNPLVGKELYGGDRFPDMSEPFDHAWRTQALELAQSLRLQPSAKEGVYIGVNGPLYDTAAEIKMFNQMGADVVGMSTVWEVIALIQMRAKVLGISCVSNFGTGVSKQALTHLEVLDAMKKSSENFKKLLTEIIQKTI